MPNNENKVLNFIKLLTGAIFIIGMVFFILGLLFEPAPTAMLPTPTATPVESEAASTAPESATATTQIDPTATMTATPMPTPTATPDPRDEVRLSEVVDCTQNHAPLADANGPYIGMLGKGHALITLDASASIDVDGNIVSYQWTFPDMHQNIEGPIIKRAYSKVGNYMATLTVTDDCGASNQALANIVITGPTPSASLKNGSINAAPSGDSVAPPTPLPTLEALPSVLLQAFWPEGLDFNQSDVVYLLMSNIANQADSPGIQITAPTLTSTNDITNGTTISLRQTVTSPVIAFAELCDVPLAEYQGFAIAELHGTAFEISPMGAQRQALNKLNAGDDQRQPPMSWVWNITPKRSGLHRTNLNFEVEWVPIYNNTAPVVQCDVWDDQVMHIVVEAEPRLALGENTFIALLGAILSLIVHLATRLIDWIIDTFRGRGRNTKQERHDKTSS